MKQDKEITLSSFEQIKYDDLTEREKLIYESGKQDGSDGAGLFMAVMVIIALLIWALIDIIY